MKFHYYHKDTGELSSSHVATNISDAKRALDFARRNAPSDHLPIKGSFDRRKHRVDIKTGKIAEVAT